MSTSEISAPAESTTAALRHIVSNGGALLLAYVLPRVFTLGAVVVAARVLGTARFGAYGTAAAFAVILSIVATLGMTPLLIREIARDPDRAPRLLRSAHRVKTAANVVMLAVLFALAEWALAYPADVVRAALLLGVAYSVSAYAENLSAYFQAVERMHVWTQASAVNGLATGALGALLVVATESVVWFCIAPIAGQVAALGWLLARAPASVRRGAPVRRRDVVRLLRALAPFAAAFVAITVYYKVDVLLLTRWRSAADVGVYTAAYKFVDATQALALVAAGAIYPRLSRAARALGDGERWAGTRATELLLLTAAPAAALLWLLRTPLVLTLYGETYGAASQVLALLTAALPALVLNILAGYVLGAAGRMLPIAAGYVAAGVVNVGLNAALIPVHGPVGAAAAMFVSEMTLAAGLLLVLRTHAAAAPAPRCIAVALAAGVGAGGFALLPVGGIAAALLYLPAVGLLYYRVSILSPAEQRAIRAAIGDGVRAAAGAGLRDRSPGG